MMPAGTAIGSVLSHGQSGQLLHYWVILLYSSVPVAVEIFACFNEPRIINLCCCSVCLRMVVVPLTISMTPHPARASSPSTQLGCTSRWQHRWRLLQWRRWRRRRPYGCHWKHPHAVPFAGKPGRLRARHHYGSILQLWRLPHEAQEHAEVGRRCRRERQREGWARGQSWRAVGEEEKPFSAKVAVAQPDRVAPGYGFGLYGSLSYQIGSL